jgi:exonuclease SbcC
MLNLKSDKANIEFEFLNFEERNLSLYWKGIKKRFEETRTWLAYEWKEEEWVPMTS